MTPEAAHEVLQFLLPQLTHESAMTRPVLAAVPVEGSDYKPAENCMTGAALAGHIALTEAFFLRGVVDGAFEWKQVDFATPAEALAYYDEHVPGLLEKVAQLPAEKLVQTFGMGGWNDTAIGFLNTGLKHTIHHRGQLTAYLRPMGAKVPSIYGRSGDEPKSAMAE